ncbi:hypothetical protein C2S53_019928 [Perilla frutescens var. hirtella]|uniref:Uncharacterized protein n=1 Tax=Perilla frutescens var. hirtella TaxID=608512 RepID=A0AAD4PDB8_PERFH|nr:hypothetical protein C2S53_019928 [Perilla frutescens var. hirtella]
MRSGFPWAMIVAAGTVDRWFAGTLTLGNGKKITGRTTFPARAVVRNVALVYNETSSGCTSPELTEAPDNSIIICNTTIGNTDFDTIMGGFSDSNARAVIVISEDTRIFRFNTFPYPGVVITPAEGEEVVNYALNSGSDSPTISIVFQQTIIEKEPRAVPTLSND